MAEIYSQNQRAAGSWDGVPMRAAGLYGELQPLPLPAASPVSSAMARKPRPKPALTD